MEQGSAEWLEWRKGGIGASEVAAILGICPYMTALDLFNQKTGKTKPFEGNSATQRGHELEGRARARYELFNMEDMPPAVATHPKYDICRASFDGLNADRTRVLEIKCVGKETHAIALGGKVPDHYWPQVQMQLAVSGADQNDYFSYDDNAKSHALIHIEPDVPYQGMMIARVLEFWHTRILTNTPPPHTDRDILVIEDNARVGELCAQIKQFKNTWDKEDLDYMKAYAVELAGHPKIRCGDVQISTVKRDGKFSYHKLTLHEVKV